MANVYGSTKSETLAEENLRCRMIAKEIINLQLTDRSIWMIMYNLALELENNEDMKMAADFIKEYKGHELFVSALAEEK